jgi:hypothetical protein
MKIVSKIRISLQDSDQSINNLPIDKLIKLILRSDNNEPFEELMKLILKSDEHDFSNLSTLEIKEVGKKIPEKKKGRRYTLMDFKKDN